MTDEHEFREMERHREDLADAAYGDEEEVEAIEEVTKDDLEVTGAVIEYVQVALDSQDPQSFLFSELAALVSACAIVFGRTPEDVLKMLVSTVPQEWPDDALEQLIAAGMVVVPSDD